MKQTTDGGRHRWAAVSPGAGLLELGCQAEEGGLVAEAADEVGADGQAIGVPKSGTDMAGCPVALQIGVKGMKALTRISPWRGFSGEGSKVPRGTGGSASVGVSHTVLVCQERGPLPSLPLAETCQVLAYPHYST